MPALLTPHRLAGLLLAAGLALSAGAQTLRVTSAGDVLTLDPHAQNELMTNAINAQVYEFLVGRDQQLRLVPALATEWKQLGPQKWQFKLRPGVKFHDGRPFTADDVVFSVQRAQLPSSQIAVYANAIGTSRRVDDLTVEFTLPQVNPLFLQMVNAIYIMNKAWALEHNAGKPQDFAGKEESYAAFHANGTGPFMLVSRAPDSKTVFKRNPAYWGANPGNLQQVVYTPIASDASRTAALVSGEVDILLDPSPRDLDKLRANAALKLIEGPENRIIFIGLDQGRDQLLYGSVTGKNPFKDVRVRRALYQAIDIAAIQTKLMNGRSAPTGALAPSPQAHYESPEFETRLPFDLAAARKLLAEAGYGSGFEFTLDCPNNRYVNDERICVALASQWAKLGLKVKVNAQPKALFISKLEKLDTSAYLFGWGGSITDAETLFTSHLRHRGAKGEGEYNRGNFRDDELDATVAASSHEADPELRKGLIKKAFKREAEQLHYLPLHRQYLAWAARADLSAVQRPDGWLEWRWVSLAAK